MKTDEEQSRPDPIGWLVASVALLVLDVALPAFVLMGRTPGAVSPLALTFQTGLVVVCGFLLVATLISGQQPMHTLFLTFTYVFLGLAPLAQLAVGSVPSSFAASSDANVSLPRPIGTGEALQTSLVIGVGLLAYELGRLGHTRRRSRLLDVGNGATVGMGAARVLAHRRIRPMARLSLALTVMYALVVGPARFLGPRIQLEQRLTELFSVSEAPVVVALGTIPIWIALISFIVTRRNASSENVGSRLLRVSVGLAAVLVVNPISSPRYVVGTLYVAAFIAGTAVRSDRYLRRTLIVLIACLIVVFPYSDVFRYSTSLGIHGPSVISQFRNKLDYDSFSQISTAIQFAHDAGHTDGKQELGALLFAIPRSAWPGKPIDTGALLAGYQGASFTNTSAPLWAESYIDFGFLGVILVLALWGRLSARLDAYWLSARGGAREAMLLAVPAIAMYQLILLRGSLLAVMGRLLAIVLVTRVLTLRREKA